MGSFSIKHIIFKIKKHIRVISLMAMNIDAKLEGKLTCAFNNEMRNLTNFHGLKNSDFILEKKMAELNQNKNLKELD